MNWLALGFPKSPPALACLGGPISESQHEMLERLEGMIDYFLTAPEVSLADLGRAGDKLGNLCKMSLNLVGNHQPDFNDLHSFLDSVSSSLDPYKNPRRSSASTPEDHQGQPHSESSFGRAANGQMSSVDVDTKQCGTNDKVRNGVHSSRSMSSVPRTVADSAGLRVHRRWLKDWVVQLYQLLLIA